MTTLTPQEVSSRLEQLTELSIALGNAHEAPHFLERILRTAKRIAHADGGTLYRISADRQALEYHIIINDSLHMQLGGEHGGAIQIPPIPLYDANGEQNLSAVAACAANCRHSVNIEDVYQATGYNFSGMRQFDLVNHYRCQSLLTVPMSNHEGELVGVLQLVNAQAPGTQNIIPFNATDQVFIEALAAQAAIALSNQALIAQLENLFESLVNLINIGIDEKSPNTGRHCHHVPELTMLLADAADRTLVGPLASYKMSPKDRKELWLAGLLHDCGKITTPVHVIEKGTKLQTIIDRIELIDTRFEVLKRDAEIRCLRRQLERQVDMAEAAQQLKAELTMLDDERQFLRAANVGGERMSDADTLRVQQIAQRRWHDPSGTESNFLTADEVKNLSIKKGTLTTEERHIINNHIAVTIRMLEALPWPKHLRNVPEYAGGHHERMDGKGYPRGLRGDQMSLPARIMAIADIFEALSAKDRPYKVGKTLTESLEILGKFSQEGHIDPDLFHVFVREKVYLDYAQRFMDPAQIDEVNHAAIPGFNDYAKESIG